MLVLVRLHTLTQNSLTPTQEATILYVIADKFSYFVLFLFLPILLRDFVDSILFDRKQETNSNDTLTQETNVYTTTTTTTTKKDLNHKEILQTERVRNCKAFFLL